MMPRHTPHIAVIGAGVIGLQSALSLLEAGYRVTLVAKHLPGDEAGEYTSPWAGAHWRPHGTAQDTRQQQWDIETYNAWMALVEQEETQHTPPAARSGVAMIPSTLNYDAIPEDLWFAPHVRDFRITTPTIDGVASAATFTSFAMDAPRYIAYLLRRVRDAGGTVIKATLPTEQGMGGVLAAVAKLVTATAEVVDVDGFVNATGIAAYTVVPDKCVYPVRGQVVLVRGEAEQIRTRHGVDAGTGQSTIAYVIPRVGSGTTVLGGCNEVGNWSCEKDDAITARILDGCRPLCPELLRDGKLDVLRVIVGLRPAREGGARVQLEEVDGSEEGRRWKVVHAYGHGGAGFQNSVGVARQVVGLVGGALGREGRVVESARL